MASKRKDQNNPQPPMPPPDASAPDSLTGDDPAGDSPPKTGDASPELAHAASPNNNTLPNDRYIRLLADFDNYRKRQTREREEWVKRANEELLASLLPVLDLLDLALDKAPNPADPFVTGIGLVRDQFFQVLGRFGLTPIEANGATFDPEWHEALSQVQHADFAAGTVAEQFRRGWKLSGRLLRPAQVVVSAGPPEPENRDSAML